MKSLGLLLMVPLFAISVAGCGNQVFDGTRVAEANRFQLVFKKLNGVQTHNMRLSAGDVIDVTVQKNAGRLDIAVVDSQQKVLYQGHNASTSHFKLVVKESDAYSFAVVGKAAKGYVLFAVE